MNCAGEVRVRNTRQGKYCDLCWINVVVESTVQEYMLWTMLSYCCCWNNCQERMM